MSTYTRLSEINTFKLTGREIQEDINVEKYEALVYQDTNLGQNLRDLVEEEWPSWQKIVAEAPWLKYWQYSDAFDQPGLTPFGFEATTVLSMPIKTKKEPMCLADIGAIAQTIYSDAVWGFAIDKWLQYPWGKNPAEKKRNVSPTRMQAKIMEHQKLKTLPVNRKDTWDEKIYRGTGMLVPIEYGDFDRWLEQLWLKALTME